jgi:hypothetical protein
LIDDSKRTDRISPGIKSVDDETVAQTLLRPLSL